MLTSIQSENNVEKKIYLKITWFIPANASQVWRFVTYGRFEWMHKPCHICTVHIVHSRCKLLLCNMEIKTPNFTNEFRFFLSTNPFHLFQQRCSLSCGFLINYIHGSIFDPLVYLHLGFFFNSPIKKHEFDASIFLEFFHWKFNFATLFVNWY